MRKGDENRTSRRRHRRPCSHNTAVSDESDARRADLVLPLEKQSLEYEGANLDGIDRLKDQLDCEPVGEVADHRTPGGQDPRLIVHKPDEHLHQAQKESKEEAAGFAFVRRKRDGVGVGGGAKVNEGRKLDGWMAMLVRPQRDHRGEGASLPSSVGYFFPP